MVYGLSHEVFTRMLVKDAARIQALDVLSRHWTPNKFPVDPVRIALDMGINVYRADLDPQTSGFIVKTAGEPAAIYLNANHSNVRQNFTCAHELGHYVERYENRDDDYSFTDASEFAELRSDSRGWTVHEFYANEFAANLLMPPKAVDTLVQAGWSVPRMARHFFVSTGAMRVRLSKLRLDVVA